tara:strand:- start:2452 stop:2736 length:285 start_codon:yes stop_codon:yes gene_type:complete
MTDSSSEDNSEMTQMAGELIQAKMDAASKSSNMTHLMRLGSFQMEIVPSRDIDVEKLFKEVLADLYDKFGEEVLKINTSDIIAKKQAEMGGMHG